MGIGCPETSLVNYQSKLRNTPEERRPHLNRDRSLKSRMGSFVLSTIELLLVNGTSCNIARTEMFSFKIYALPRYAVEMQ
jgi:hypothetical protein